MLDARGGEAGRIGLDDEGAHALAATRVRIGDGEDRDEVRDRAVGDEALRAVEDVVVAVAGGPHPHCRHVAAGRRLGQGERGEPLPGGEPRQVSVLLLLGPGKQDREGAELLHGGDEAGRGVGTRDLLDKDGLGDLVECGAAVPLLEAGAEQVLLGEELLEVPRELRGGVDLRGPRRDALRRELAHDGTKLIVIGGWQVGHSAPRRGTSAWRGSGASESSRSVDASRDRLSRAGPGAPPGRR